MLRHLVPAGIIAGALGLALFAQSVTSPPADLQARLDVNPWGQLAGEFDHCPHTRGTSGLPQASAAISCAPGVQWQADSQPVLASR